MFSLYKPEKGILKVSQYQKGSNHYEGDKIVCDTSAQKSGFHMNRNLLVVVKGN
jgi:hypothetical protein